MRMIEEEYESTTSAVLRLTGRPSLLALRRRSNESPTMDGRAESDPGRVALAARGSDEEELRAAIQSTINGIAAAMQSTG